VSKNSETVFRVRVLPRASRNQVVGIFGNEIKVKLTAPPVEGKANKALQQFLAKKLGVPKTGVEIVSGRRSRVKSIRINGLSAGDVEEMLKV